MTYTDSPDTPDALKEQLKRRLNNLSPEEKLARICSLSAFGRQFTLEHLKQKHPELSTAELRIELVRHTYGEDLLKLVR